ncbi:MAG: histidine triad nucleotide-binding protein [Bacillota bacterium]
MIDCIFCKIAAKEIPCELVFESDDVVAINDISPVAPIHILIMTKKHYANINDLIGSEKNLLIKLFDAVAQVAKDKGISDSGYRLIINSGVNGGQTVPHLHFHLISGTKLSKLLV